MFSKKSLSVLLGLMITATSAWSADVEFKLPSDNSGALTVDRADGVEAFSVQADGTTKVETQTGGAVISGVDGSLVQPLSIGDDSLVLHAQGGSHYRYVSDWVDNSPFTPPLDEVVDLQDGYDPATGEYVAQESGLYSLHSQLMLVRQKDSSDVFDGTGGTVKTYLLVNDQFIATSHRNIFRGTSPTLYITANNSLIHLNAGDVVKTTIVTSSANNMGSDLENKLYIGQGGSSLKIYKY